MEHFWRFAQGMCPWAVVEAVDREVEVKQQEGVLEEKGSVEGKGAVEETDRRDMCPRLNRRSTLTNTTPQFIHVILSDTTRTVAEKIKSRPCQHFGKST